MWSIVAKLLAALDVDAVQWRVLVLTALRVDLRTTGAMSMSRIQAGSSGASSGKSSLRGFVFTLGFMGFFLSLIVYLANDLFFSLTLFFSFLLFSVASSLLLEYQAIVLSPDDYRQLGYQPITSRTFFAARLTSVLIYVWIMTAALGLAPIIAVGLTRNGGVVAALMTIFASLLATTTTAVMVVALYGWLLQIVPAARLKRALTWLQLAATFLVYASYFLLPRLLGTSGFQQWTMPRVPWIWLVPGTWYGSIVEAVVGRAEPVQFVVIGVTIVLAVSSVLLSSGRLTLDYADRLSALTTDTAVDAQTAAARLRAGRVFRDGERRAVALLVKGLFRYDMRFRLGVLGIIPLTVIYLVGGFGAHGGITDPFVMASRRGEPQLVYYAVLFFPTMLRQVMSRSDAYRAAWIFLATPADMPRLVLAIKDFVMAYFVLPYLAFFGVLVAYWFTRLDHLAVLIVTLALLCHLVLLMQVLLRPELPFSQPEAKGSRSQMMIFAIGLSFVAVWLPWLLHMAFETPTRAAITMVSIVIANLALQQATVLRVTRIARRAEVQL